MGYLDKEAFKNLLGLRGLNLQLTPEQLDMLAHEVADDNGAVEPKAFTKFLAVRSLLPTDSIEWTSSHAYPPPALVCAGARHH